MYLFKQLKNINFRGKIIVCSTNTYLRSKTKKTPIISFKSQEQSREEKGNTFSPAMKKKKVLKKKKGLMETMRVKLKVRIGSNY